MTLEVLDEDGFVSEEGRIISAGDPSKVISEYLVPLKSNNNPVEFQKRANVPFFFNKVFVLEISWNLIL